MSTGRMIELVAAVLILGFGIWLYRRNKAVDGGYGSQGAVLLFVVAAIMLIHSLGGLDYHPSQSELEMIRERSQ
jgi:ABC-type nickel/cobalt efflux system permease component RcnA